MKKITLDYTRVMKTLSSQDFDKIAPEVRKAKETVDTRSGPGKEYLGWLDLPTRMDPAELEDIQKTAFEVRGNSDALLVLGIGGSYLGARAALSALLSNFHNESSTSSAAQLPRIYFVGCEVSPAYFADLLDVLKGRRITINVVSKSGTTTEPALAFRLLKDIYINKFGKEEAKRRVIATTDKSKGALKRLADREGYKTFVIPDDVGGRYSVLTPVGLLPIAVGGIDIKQMMEGARDAVKLAAETDFNKNVPCMYAAIRNLLLSKGKGIEILASFEPGLHYMGEWWKQLFGESEGKDNKGIYPDSLDFTTDLHSMGQYIQDGVRNLFETFLWSEEERASVIIPHDDQNLDNLNYLEGKSLHFVNSTAVEGVAAAHQEGGVPNMTIKLPAITPYYVGQLFYLFEYACAVSGYMLGVNPFNQPGVESYKKNMFALLGKPGFEAQYEALKKSKAHQASYEV
ncbi:MAG: glucose-6-phosphate isomerase [Candidatus Eremiobacteraeota bacterium]|nr:glucose-6-phosphate isomerase [Candidatus Eremiobacteraeota bacterium]